MQRVSWRCKRGCLLRSQCAGFGCVSLWRARRIIPMKQHREKAWDVIDRDGLRKRLNELLDRPLGTDDKEFTRMKNGLSNKKDYIFTFPDNPGCPIWQQFEWTGCQAGQDQNEGRRTFPYVLRSRNICRVALYHRHCQKASNVSIPRVAINSTNQTEYGKIINSCFIWKSTYSRCHQRERLRMEIMDKTTWVVTKKTSV